MTASLFVAVACKGGGSGNPAPDPGRQSFSWLDETQVENYIGLARQAWSDHGGSGLVAVIAALEAQGYDYDQIRADLLTHGEYELIDLGISDMVHPFTLANFDAAISAGLSGDGTTIAITDAGFDLDHPDLAGKIVRCFDGNGTEVTDTCPEDNHGTGVSVVAAGNLNDDGWMGVAHEADLLLFHWGMDLVGQKDEAGQIRCRVMEQQLGLLFQRMRH